MRIKLFKDPYDSGWDIFSKQYLTLNPGVSILVGCNGYGKTTLMQTLKEYAQTHKIPLFHWDNTKDVHSARERAGWLGNTTFLATATCSSEGEEIIMNLGQNVAKPIGKLMRDNPDKKQFIVLLDAIDSGLSLDNIEDFKRFLIETLLPMNADKELYIVISTNSYEFCIGEQFQCLDVYKCKYVNLKTYNAFRKLVMNSRKIVDARYHKD